jgi:hypothetical protein
MSFFDKFAPNPGKTLLSELHKRCPNIFLVIFRNKNKNVVIYESIMKDGKIDSIDIYWLDIDENFRNNRDKSILHDRSELTYFERAYVYGANITNFITPLEVEIKFNADSSTPMRVKSSNGKSQLFVVYKGTKYMIRSLYIASTENIKLLRLEDNVSEVTFQAFNLKTKLVEQIRIK